MDEQNQEPRAVFVYGTLMRGEARSAVIADSMPKCWLLAQCGESDLFDLGSYPAMSPIIPNRRESSELLAGFGVEGEEVEVSAYNLLSGLTSPGMVQGEYVVVSNLEGLLRKLDDIEGFRVGCPEDSLFLRIPVTVDMHDGHLRSAWTYVAPDAPEGPRIVSGDWRQHTGRRETALRAIAEAHFADNVAEVLARITGRNAWRRHENPLDVIQSYGEPKDMLLNRTISERKLAQASGRWAVIQ